MATPIRQCFCIAILALVGSTLAHVVPPPPEETLADNVIEPPTRATISRKLQIDKNVGLEATNVWATGLVPKSDQIAENGEFEATNFSVNDALPKEAQIAKKGESEATNLWVSEPIAKTTEPELIINK
ncbi:hypothetical protein L6452_19798 [Arctium lappa]|uniref:Uncharacterized protein n=1 Tax=Arctium lappa TaxID=4217 RepID=A0ACB9BAF3_ARCLA|nr:hypothetical protein L6452_19798 [Arctium lappa]